MQNPRREMERGGRDGRDNRGVGRDERGRNRQNPVAGRFDSSPKRPPPRRARAASIDSVMEIEPKKVSKGITWEIFT